MCWSITFHLSPFIINNTSMCVMGNNTWIINADRWHCLGVLKIERQKFIEWIITAMSLLFCFDVFLKKWRLGGFHWINIDYCNASTSELALFRDDDGEITRHLLELLSFSQVGFTATAATLCIYIYFLKMKSIDEIATLWNGYNVHTANGILILFMIGMLNL